jgi:L,D-transpeptidase catalytic domain
VSQVRGSHRASPVRPRYGRLGALGASLAVTAIALLGSFGSLPFSGGGDAAGQWDPAGAAAAAIGPTLAPPAAERTPVQSADAAGDGEAQGDPALDTTLPEDSGAGKRVVFSESRQRVWLVGERGRVTRTYLVSGSAYDNLDPGTYQVYSRSERARGIDDSGTMNHFVRFTQGDRAAIGFHDIPVDEGKPVQTVAQLGTPLSHGCIRQKKADAIALWEFAPLGTNVVVTA